MNVKFLLPGNRGQLLALLRGGPLSVNELADALQLTDNGVRAHLATLQSDGLIKTAGERPGSRKPHQLFALTAAGRRYLPTVDGPLLQQLLSTLSHTIPKESLNAFLKRIGTDLADTHETEFKNASPEKQLKVALRFLGEIGGDAEVQEHNGCSVIQGRHCPFSNFVPAHPEICAVAQGLLERILDRKVVEQCQKGRNPCCRFELAAA